MKSRLYYEAHVTLKPVPEEVRDGILREIAHINGFRVAKLLMQKGGPCTEDAFCTARDSDYETIRCRTVAMVQRLLSAGFTVRRYKIEDTLIDSKMGDEWDLLCDTSSG